MPLAHPGDDWPLVRTVALKRAGCPATPDNHKNIELAICRVRTAANWIEKGWLVEAYTELTSAQVALKALIDTRQDNAGTQRPGTSDAEPATRTPMPGSLE